MFVFVGREFVHIQRKYEFVVQKNGNREDPHLTLVGLDNGMFFRLFVLYSMFLVVHTQYDDRMNAWLRKETETIKQMAGRVIRYDINTQN